MLGGATTENDLRIEADCCGHTARCAGLLERKTTMLKNQPGILNTANGGEVIGERTENGANIPTGLFVRICDHCEVCCVKYVQRTCVYRIQILVLKSSASRTKCSPGW